MSWLEIVGLIGSSLFILCLSCLFDIVEAIGNLKRENNALKEERDDYKIIYEELRDKEMYRNKAHKMLCDIGKDKRKRLNDENIKLRIEYGLVNNNK